MTARRASADPSGTHRPRARNDNTYGRPEGSGVPADVAGALREARTARGWSLWQAGRELGTDGAYVLRLERGERWPSVAMAELLVLVYRLDGDAAGRLLRCAVPGVGRSNPKKTRRRRLMTHQVGPSGTPATSADAPSSHGISPDRRPAGEGP